MYNEIFPNFKIEEWLEPEQLENYKRNIKKNDSNINKFRLPIRINNDNEYVPILKQELERFYNYLINKPEFNEDTDLICKVKDNSKIILRIIECSDIELARKEMKELLKRYIENDNGFILSELDKSYAFRGASCLPELRNKDECYKEINNDMQTYELEFFRARKRRNTDEKFDRNDMLHIKLNEKEKFSVQRFSTNNIPAIYLGTTSYVCFLELNKPSKDDFYISSYRFNKLGGKLRILNLVIGEGLINGIYNPMLDSQNGERKNMKKNASKLRQAIARTLEGNEQSMNKLL